MKIIGVEYQNDGSVIATLENGFRVRIEGLGDENIQELVNDAFDLSEKKEKKGK